jgi:Ser/Thr protein kinase RdoA (MazF antagonist)
MSARTIRSAPPPPRPRSNATRRPSLGSRTRCDYCPGNAVFRDGPPVALIDFDPAKPATRLYDIANALWYWALTARLAQPG